jgi:flagellar biosynthetic protein FliO
LIQALVLRRRVTAHWWYLVCSASFSVTRFKKKTVVLLIIAALGNGALIVCSARSSVGGTVSGELTAEPNGPQPAGTDEDGGLFAKDLNFSDRSDYRTGNGEIFLRAMLAVLFVAVLGVAAMYVSKRFLPRITRLPGKEIRIVETVHIGPRRAVHLIEIGDRRILIGSTNENVTKLADVTPGPATVPAQEMIYN